MMHADEWAAEPALAELVPTPRSPSTVAVSVVVPTRNEAPNVGPLLHRLDEALAGTTAEVIFVDDSDDDTPSAIHRASGGIRLPVRVHHRTAGHREGGLGGAVIHGFRLCRAEYAVVIDGDLQHPPETVSELHGAARAHDADLVVASRYVSGGSAGGLHGWARRMVSSASNLLSHLTFPRRLRGVTDPMSGFFLVRVGALDLARLRPDGYKILLELLVRTRLSRVAEVPYTFAERHAGESNASMSEGLRFVRRLFTLRVPRPARFAIVGASGTAPNVLGTWALHALGLHYLIAAVAATQLAILWNYIGCELLVWGKSKKSRVSRYLPFAVVNNLDLAVRIPLLAFLVDRVGIGVGTATFATLAVAVVVRYLVVDRVIYRDRAVPRPGSVDSLATAVPASVPASRTAMDGAVAMD
jgi:dolichol-phosphate mannosyltransferase